MEEVQANGFLPAAFAQTQSNDRHFDKVIQKAAVSNLLQINPGDCHHLVEILKFFRFFQFNLDVSCHGVVLYNYSRGQENDT